jgi:hypothetical protein
VFALGLFFGYVATASATTFYGAVKFHPTGERWCDAYMAHHRATLNLVPQNHAALLWAGGTTIHLGCQPVPRFPGNEWLSTVHPGGWPVGSTWMDVAGMYYDLEVFVGRTERQAYSPCCPLALHEVGHAIYDQLGLRWTRILTRKHQQFLPDLGAYFQNRDEWFAELYAGSLYQGLSWVEGVYDRETRRLMANILRRQ